MTREAALEELAKAFDEHKGSVFVGAGASFDAGLPSWSRLLVELVAELEKVPGIDAGTIESCKRMASDKSKWFSLAGILRRNLAQRFDSYIEDRFCASCLKPTQTHKAISNLPWNFVATTNYDDLLETAFAEKYSGSLRVDGITYDKPGEIASYFYKGKKFVLYCHGRARTDPSHLVLTNADYRSLVHQQPGYQSILQTLFTSTSFLFVGASLNDPDIQLVLDFLHSSFHKRTPTQYALIPDSERESAELTHMFHEYNLHVVALPDKDYGQHVVEFLDELRRRLT